METRRDEHDLGAVFVNQAGRGGLVGPLASWITIAGWAVAAERRYGRAWMATTEGVLAPADALVRASTPARASTDVARWRRRFPQVLRTAVHDARRPAANRRFDVRLGAGPWDHHDVRFVLQLHGLWCDAGLRLARRLDVPSVLVVDAVIVEEARSWGTHRPGWSRTAIRFGERPQFRRADLVACVSAEVAAMVTEHSGRRDGVVTIPNGVDTERFTPGAPDPALRSALGLDDAFVVGWTGSFRRFHGLDWLVDAAARLAPSTSNLAVLLVGDGLQRSTVEQRARELGVRLVTPGTVPYHDVPSYLRCMDVAVVLGDPGRSFHYSPVKLREYQACALPVVAAATGELGRAVGAGTDTRLVRPGDVDGLATALAAIRDDPDGARALGLAGRAAVEASGSWTSRLIEVEQLLGIGPPP